MVILALLVVGCGTAGAQTASPTPSTQVPETPLNIDISNQQTGIWVSGQGIVTITPDIALLDLGVSAQADTVAEAQSQAAGAMDEVIAVLLENGIQRKDIQTRQFSITPLTRFDETTRQTTITGYQVDNIVNVKVRSVENTGAIIDAVAEAAGNLTRINNISFSTDNPEQYHEQARELAMNDARAKAEQLAGLAGVTLGEPTFISENSAPIPFRSALPGGVEAAPSPTTPITPGQLEINLFIQVAYAIE